MIELKAPRALPEWWLKKALPTAEFAALWRILEEDFSMPWIWGLP